VLTGLPLSFGSQALRSDAFLPFLRLDQFATGCNARIAVAGPIGAKDYR
jgi:hypothetical protein